MGRAFGGKSREYPYWSKSNPVIYTINNVEYTTKKINSFDFEG